MTQIVGAGIVALLVVALLAREACVIGAVHPGPGARRALDVSIGVLAVVFVAVITFHLVRLL
jgi:hypothetical protein